jgi:uracil-DNA glycosylase
MGRMMRLLVYIPTAKGVISTIHTFIFAIKRQKFMNVKMEASWKSVLQDEFEKEYFKGIVDFLKAEKELGKTIYPPGPQIFNAFNLTPFDQTKVVILGQDPYHGEGQAHGLSFSVPAKVKKLPPSLKNIIKELNTDIGMPIENSCGDLQSWAQQGVLLLNASLSVRAGEPMSHAQIGWATFTDAVIELLSYHKNHLVFILWGKFAQQKLPLIDEHKHLVIQSAHPSPFSAEKGFFGSNPFSKSNAFLMRNGINPIDWSLNI